MQVSYPSLESRFPVPDFSCFSLRNWLKGKITFVKGVLDNQTDTIHNLGILAITTCLLASKIFEHTPKFLPRLAKVVYDYGSIIWLNVQIRDLLKSWKDFSRAFKSLEFIGMVETAAKVFVKGVNVLLTCAYFGGALVSAFIFPQASLMIAMSVRSFSLTSLLINIISDVRDYAANEALLKRLEKLEADPQGSLLIGKVMVCFLEIIKNVKTPSTISFKWKAEWKLADSLVRQLESYTLETFEKSLKDERKEKIPLIDALKLFYGVKDGMIESQARTKANLSLTALGYIAMGISRAFPDTLNDMLARWCTSVLYTDMFIQGKFFQSDLAERLN